MKVRPYLFKHIDTSLEHIHPLDGHIDTMGKIYYAERVYYIQSSVSFVERHCDSRENV